MGYEPKHALPLARRRNVGVVLALIGLSLVGLIVTVLVLTLNSAGDAKDEKVETVDADTLSPDSQASYDDGYSAGWDGAVDFASQGAATYCRSMLQLAMMAGGPVGGDDDAALQGCLDGWGDRTPN